MKYEYLIFDWDGTLIDTSHAWHTFWRKSYMEYGIQYDEEKLLQEIDKDWENAPAAFGISDPRKFIKEALINNKEMITRSPLFEPVKRIIDLDIPKSIVTSSISEIMEPSLRFHNISNSFDEVITKDQVYKPKPNPEGINRIIKKYNLDRDKVLMIGDSMNDVFAAKNANIDSVLINTYGRYDVFAMRDSGAEHVFGSLSEFESML